MTATVTVLASDLTRLLTFSASAPIGVGNNQQVFGGQAGLKFRVVGWIAQSQGAGLSTFTLETGTLGHAIMAPLTVPGNGAGLSHLLPIYAPGYMETVVSEGLYISVTTTGLNITVFYITYVP